MDQQIIPIHSTMASEPPWRQGPAISVRRFGQNDFERFDEENARGSHLSVGQGTVGKVEIDCKYHWKRCQWGVLGQQRNPAGIVYMDITFNQPPGYWLEHATVYITMGEDTSSYALAKRKSLPDHRLNSRSHRSEYTVQISSFGPSFLTGAKTYRSERTTSSLVPTVSAMGFELGGLGRQSSSVQERTGAWTFKGTVCKPKGRSGFRTLQWELTENRLAPEQPHKHEYRTAFAFEHSRRPVYMRVEVEGRLRSKMERVAHSLARFSSAMGKRDDSTLTHMDFSRRAVPKRRLDDVVRGLNMAMQMENLTDGPMEVPDPAPAVFTQEQAPLTLAEPGHHRVASGTMSVNGPNGREETGGRARREDPNVPLLSVLRRRLEDRPAIPHSASHLGIMTAPGYRAESSATTMDDTDAQSTTVVNSEWAATSTRHVRYDVYKDSKAELLNNPAVMVLVHLILGLSSLVAFVGQLIAGFATKVSSARPGGEQQGAPHDATATATTATTTTAAAATAAWKRKMILPDPSPRSSSRPYDITTGPQSSPRLEPATYRGEGQPSGVRQRTGLDRTHVLRRALEEPALPVLDNTRRGWSSA